MFDVSSSNEEDERMRSRMLWLPDLYALAMRSPSCDCFCSMSACFSSISPCLVSISPCLDSMSACFWSISPCVESIWSMVVSSDALREAYS